MLVIRKAKQQDSEIIRRWRNDPTTRKNSFTAQLIDRKEHQAWFKKTINNKKTLLLIAEEDTIPVAVLRINILDNDNNLLTHSLTQSHKIKYAPGQTAEVHIIVAPSSRGKGIGTRALKSASRYALKHGIKRLIAQIKPENQASIKTFLKAGFKQVSKNSSKITMKLVIKKNYEQNCAPEKNHDSNTTKHKPTKYKPTKNTGFIVYADNTIGTGHILRCLTLAKEISNNKEFSYTIHFFANTLSRKIKEAGFEFHKTTPNESDVKKINKKYNLDCIVADIPEIKATEVLKNNLISVAAETRMISKIIFIDYEYKNQQTKLINNIIETPIISTQFEKMNYLVRKKINTILLTFGGSDPTNATLKVLSFLELFLEKTNTKIIIVVGALYPYERELTKYIQQITRKNKIKQKNIVLMKNIKNMPEVMTTADIAFSSPGATAYELCAVGVPTLLLAQNEKQSIAAQNLESKGAAINLGSAQQITREKTLSAIHSLNYKKRKELSRVVRRTEKELNQSKAIVNQIIGIFRRQNNN